MIENTDTKMVGLILTTLLREKGISYEENENAVILKDYDNKQISYKKSFDSVEVNLKEITDLSFYEALNRELWLRVIKSN